MTAASQAAAADGKLTRKEEREAAQALVAEIRRLAVEIGRPLRYMEVCGTHTVSIFRAGIRQLLPENVALVSGPGCPVCVTADDYMDKAIAYAHRDDVILVTFGDMLKVPGSRSSLAEAKAEGADIRIVYSTRWPSHAKIQRKKSSSSLSASRRRPRRLPLSCSQPSRRGFRTSTCSRRRSLCRQRCGRSSWIQKSASTASCCRAMSRS